MSVNKILDFEAVADAVIQAHTVIEEHGTPEMKAIINLLLFNIGKEIAKNSFVSDEKDPRQGKNID